MNIGRKGVYDGTTIPDPRRAQGWRHSLPSALAIATAATLCGMRGYKAIAGWARDLKPRPRERFRCRRERGSYRVPSESIIRDMLMRVDPTALDQALQQGNQRHAGEGSRPVRSAWRRQTACVKS